MKKTLFLSIIIIASQMLFAQAYHIGELVTNPDGSQGIIFYVNQEDQTAWMVALNDASTGIAWGLSVNLPHLDDIIDEFIYEFPLFYDLGDGYENTAQMKAAGSSWASSCVDFDNGWFIPSTAQLTTLFNALAHIEDPLRAAGGTTLDNDSFYWSSNEQSAAYAYAVDFGYNYQCGHRLKAQKTSLLRVRAIHSLDFVILPSIGSLDTPPTICDQGVLELVEPNHSNDDTHGWEISADSEFSNPIAYTGQELDVTYDGWFLRFWASNEYGRNESNIVRVRVGQPSFASVDETTCYDTYLWDGEWCDTAGIYTHHYLTALGCDSILELNLNFQTEPSSIQILPLSTCDAFYFWDGEFCDSTGIYTHTYVTETGCDSILQLDLTILSSTDLSKIHGDSIIFIEDETSHVYSIDSIEDCLGYEWSIDNPLWTVDYSSDSPVCSVTPITRENALLTVKVYTRCGTAIKNIRIIHSAEPELIVYPSPTSGPVTFDLFGTEGEVIFEIFDGIGNLIDRFSVDTDISGTRFMYYFTTKACGIYNIRVINQHQQLTRRIIKE